MGKIPYLSAGFLASVTLLVNLVMQNNSLSFSLFRAAFVMIGVLFMSDVTLPKKSDVAIDPDYVNGSSSQLDFLKDDGSSA